jgi:ferredoxin-NADP reductase
VCPDGSPVNARGLELRVQRLSYEAEDVLSVELVDPSGAELPEWRPGAHLDVTLGGQHDRQFSLCGDLADRHRYTVAVLKESDSRGGSQYVHEQLRPGDLVKVRDVRKNFHFLLAPSYLFVAGGIGITPLLPMVAEAAKTGADFHLIYGGRKRSSMAFLDRLAAYGDRVRVFPEDHVGMIPLDRLLGQPDDLTKIYCCGPERLLVAVEQLCKQRWREDALEVERFRPKAIEAAPVVDAANFEVFCQRSNVSVKVGPDTSVLEALRDSGVEVNSFCEEGVCGTCETRMIEGEADHRDSILTDREKAANKTMMICCSRAKSARLVLDL